MMLMNEKSRRNEKKIGSIIVFSQDVLRDWLKKLWKTADPNYNFDEAVDEVIVGLSPRYEEWIKELAETYSELKGESLKSWLPAARELFAEHVDFYVLSKFGETPDNFIAALNNLLTDRLRFLVK